MLADKWPDGSIYLAGALQSRACARRWIVWRSMLTDANTLQVSYVHDEQTVMVGLSCENLNVSSYVTVRVPALVSLAQ
jgi:hypothetical protein